MKQFDLAMSINTRGTFMCAKYCIPHLAKSSNPHILTISPPKDMGPTNWFGRISTGYVLAKYGMTLVTYGLSDEQSDNGVGCNTLWPRTSIATAAIKNVLGGEEGMRTSRSPEIMADAAHVILTSDAKKTNGQFFIDDEVLASAGVNDFTKYKMDPKGSDAEILPDFIM